MLNAWEQVFGSDSVPAGIDEGTTEADKARDWALVNAAWDLARREGFDLEAELPLSCDAWLSRPVGEIGGGQ